MNATSSEKDNLTFFKILITVASVVNGRLIRMVPSVSEDVSTRDVVGAFTERRPLITAVLKFTHLV